MESQSLIQLLVIGIVLSKAIIAVLIYYLVKKNRALKQKQKKLEFINAELEKQRDQISCYNEELKASEQYKIKVISIASHDLRTPFASLEMLLNFVNISVLSKTELENIHQEIVKKVSVSRKMMDEVLLWTESQLRNNLQNRETVNISAHINDLVALFNHDIQSKQLKVMNTVSIHLNVEMYKDVFSFVIRNVISNSVKFCKISGNIRIGVWKIKSDELQILIENEGDEISEEALGYLNTGSSWDLKKSKNDRGAGLGISLCKDLLNRIGGSLMFESKENVGVKVLIAFPFTQVENKTKIPSYLR